ncbi:bifunctional enoyl-CoA hydratase/phosphate acetyltransferase [Fuchsiella alkaliacetigena]|uniref:bifunctional enoyl-CoA hydratase/phosphate acetyltransferase n=1 Tax=Fuchsiella alkaliacetigena TaxID=957042 RepID=UPI00200B6A82|nr:bifunctional enoyl-CoA hydratase/phosphate acetyltransferase [Fuchsiella alkaliacetigena]MCK8824059.1 bifunctional enoyl-CoA hydratase/phosphate acetyltransferase [Fuchsiella alkaliacetigena]
MFSDFDELLNAAKKAAVKRLVVAAAGEKEVLKAVKLAIEEGLVEATLVGAVAEIKAQAAEVGLDLSEVELVSSQSQAAASKRAVKLVSEGSGDILMKGLVDTSLLMKEVLNEEYGLRQEQLISHIAMVEAESLGRLVFISDGGMNLKPELKEKQQIIQNAVDVTAKLGWDEPKVAVLAAVEKVNPQMPETVEAAALAKMAQRGQITGALVEGPLAIDIALSKEAAKMKGVEGQVAGQADILIVPEIVAGNILGKSTIYFAEARIAALIGGTTQPVVLTSRANTAQIKLISIAATVLMSE